MTGLQAHPTDDPANTIPCDCVKQTGRWPKHTSICSRNVWGMTKEQAYSYWRGMA